MNTDGNAVHFRFHDVLYLVPAQLFPDGGVKRREFFQRLFILRAIAPFPVRFLVLRRLVAGFHLVQRQHRREVSDPRELFARRAAHALGGGGRGDQPGKFLLQLLQLLVQGVVFAVGDFRPALDVIGVVVPPDFGDQLVVAGFGLGRCHSLSVPRWFREGKTFLTAARLC